MQKTVLASAVALAALASIPAKADFIEDSKASVLTRNFYMAQDFREQPVSGQSRREEWAQGFIGTFESGFTEGTVGFGVDLTGALGLKLDGGRGTGGTGLLQLDNESKKPQHSYSDLHAAAKLRYRENVLRVGALPNNQTLFRPNETRLLPAVFKGSMLTSKEINNLTLDIGRVERINKRDSSDYEPLAVTTGGRRGIVVNPGMNASGKYDFINANYQLQPNWLLNVAHGDMDDVYRQTMVNTTHTWKLGERRWLKSDLRYARSVGQRGALLDNDSYGAMFTYGFGSHSLAAAYQAQSGETGFAYINGTDPYLVNFVQINAFANRDEKSWQLKYTYDFSEIGIPGLTFMTRYISGDNVERADGREGREWERDMDIAYTIQDGTFKGLNLMWRNASSRGDAEIGNNNQDENRLIAAYTWKLW
jgi:hypothetical protein